MIEHVVDNSLRVVNAGGSSALQVTDQLLHCLCDVPLMGTPPTGQVEGRVQLTGQFYVLLKYLQKMLS